MRIAVTVLVVFLCVPAMAGMTADQMRARLKEIDAEFQQFGRGPHVQTLESIVGDLRDVERRKFESSLDLARLNARREVVLVHAKEEEDRNKRENAVLQQNLEALQKQRSLVQSEMAKIAEKIDAGQLPAQEVTPIKLQLIKLDQEAATLQYEMSGGGSHFSEALTEIEIDLAGVNAVRKALDQRGEELNQNYQQLLDAKDNEKKLQSEQLILIRELGRLDGVDVK